MRLMEKPKPELGFDRLVKFSRHDSQSWNLCGQDTRLLFWFVPISGFERVIFFSAAAMGLPSFKSLLALVMEIFWGYNYFSLRSELFFVFSQFGCQIFMNGLFVRESERRIRSICGLGSLGNLRNFVNLYMCMVFCYCRKSLRILLLKWQNRVKYLILPGQKNRPKGSFLMLSGRNLSEFLCCLTFLLGLL